MDRELVPLMECFTNVAVALRQNFELYAKPVFDKAQQVILAQQQAKQAQVSARLLITNSSSWQGQPRCREGLDVFGVQLSKCCMHDEFRV